MRLGRFMAAMSAFALVTMHSAMTAQAATPSRMMADCRVHAGQALKTRLPNIDTKYEGQRTDGTHAVNGTAVIGARTTTFQCSFNRAGTRIARFVVNEPSARPPSQNVSAAEASCLAAVANSVGVGGVSTIRVSKRLLRTIVLVRVPGAQKPWQCDYSGGRVTRVMYTGQG